MNKKKLIILSAVVLILIITLFIIVFSVKNKIVKVNIENGNTKTENFTPEFLSGEEKVKLGIPVDRKIQAVTRDKNGTLTVYKVINKDSDITIPSTKK